MRSIRRLSYIALGIAFAQIVFGAIVRITGSGWGCGEHWPKCAGFWIPPLERPDLIIEVSHRYLALGVTLVTLALAIVAWRRRGEPGVAGRGGPLRPAIGAFGVVIATALLGMVTIKLRLNPIVIVLHLALAMTLLATIIVAGIRAGGFGVERATLLDSTDDARSAAARSWRVARIAVILAFIVLVLGALTANLGAAGACLGFPNCRIYSSPNRGLVHLQLTHRVVALLFALHVLGAAMMIRRRAVAPIVKRAVWLALGAIVLQIIVAASLVELHLPPVLQSLHQAVGTLVWITVVIWASLANRAAGREPAVLMTGSPGPVPADRDGDRVVRRPEPVTAGSPLMVSSPSIDAGTIARFGEFERAGRTYEAAIAALVAEAEAIADSFDESLVVVTAEQEVPPPAALPPAADIAPAGVPACETNYDQYVTNAGAGGDVDAAAVVAPLPDPEPVTLPEHVVTPLQPIAAIKRPHSVAVIVARGADF